MSIPSLSPCPYPHLANFAERLASQHDLPLNPYFTHLLRSQLDCRVCLPLFSCECPRQSNRRQKLFDHVAVCLHVAHQQLCHEGWQQLTKCFCASIRSMVATWKTRQQRVANVQVWDVTVSPLSRFIAPCCWYTILLDVVFAAVVGVDAVLKVAMKARLRGAHVHAAASSARPPLPPPSPPDEHKQRE
jgi:hypothetical protein